MTDFARRNPSHVNAETPGAIHEGGELGYALSVAYGSVMDSPDLITVVLVGDGEAESGPTAAAWHAHKYIDPAESGAVLPVLHLNVSPRMRFRALVVDESFRRASKSPNERSQDAWTRLSSQCCSLDMVSPLLASRCCVLFK